MLDEDALEVVKEESPGFYSHLFLVAKASGDWRLVSDLPALTKTETVASALMSIRESDFMALIYLKDAYFQVPIHESSWKFLLFVCQRVTYHFKVLCFGLLIAPQVFTRVFTVVLVWAHAPDIHFLHYLDG